MRRDILNLSSRRCGGHRLSPGSPRPVDHAGAIERPPYDDGLKRQSGSVIEPAVGDVGQFDPFDRVLEIGHHTQIVYAANATPAHQRSGLVTRATAPASSHRPVMNITIGAKGTHDGVIASSSSGAIRCAVPAAAKKAARIQRMIERCREALSGCVSEDIRRRSISRLPMPSWDESLANYGTHTASAGTKQLITMSLPRCAYHTTASPIGLPRSRTMARSGTGIHWPSIGTQ